MSTAGKRAQPTDPLTEHDVAERLNRSALRTIEILRAAREADGDLFADVRRSRYLASGLLAALAEELQHWT